MYVASLARHLQQRGVTVTVAAPGEQSACYEYNGLAVRRFAVSKEVGDIRDLYLYGGGDALAAQEFATILDEEQPDIVHLHAFTRGASLRLVQAAKRRGIKVVFTYHTPTVSCQRGTLMRWGREVCDGRLELHTCSQCTLQGLGLSKMNSLVLGSLPASIGRLVGAAGLSGGGWTALRMTELVQLQHSAFRTLMAEVDHVVALCQWVKDVLLRNGVPAEKISVSRHGLPQALVEGAGAENSLPPPVHAPLRVACLGRLDPTKGLDILIQALRLLPEAAVELHLYGIVQSAAGTAYMQQLKALAADDPRIAFLPPISSDRIVSLLGGYHFLAVPSRWLETGPLVVLEAFAAGIPVIGSDLGGIAELIKHEVNGLLVEPDSVEAWRQVIRRCCEDRALLERLQTGIRPPRRMDTVAQDMLSVYEQALQLTLVNRDQNYLP